MVCSQANLTTKILYRLGTVENCVPEKNSSLLSKKKRKNMQLPIEVWKLIFMYLRLNDLIEISSVC